MMSADPPSTPWHIPTLAITFHNIVSAIFRDNMRYYAISGDFGRFYRASGPFTTPQIHVGRAQNCARRKPRFQRYEPIDRLIEHD